MLAKRLKKKSIIAHKKLLIKEYKYLIKELNSSANAGDFYENIYVERNSLKEVAIRFFIRKHKNFTIYKSSIKDTIYYRISWQ